MNIAINSNVSLSQGMKESVKESLRSVGRHFPHIQGIDVLLKIDGCEHVCEMQCNFIGQPIFSSDSTEDMYKSVKSAATKLESQLAKHQDKARSN
jgi:ribosomal subunit interface protein